MFVRSAQVHALCPMMQFSAAPWRVLDKKHLAAVKKAVDLRMKFTPRFWLSDDGKTVEGPCRISVATPLERLPHFLKVQ